MATFNGYQIALVVVLVMNLIFWVLVICFRIFFDFTCCEPQGTGRRRRVRRVRRHFQDSRNSSNRSLVGIDNPQCEDFGPHQCPYSINGALDAPPTYADAIKHVVLAQPDRILPPFPNNFPERMQARRPLVYEQSVTLVVPEESTSTPSHSSFVSSEVNRSYTTNQNTRSSANETNFNGNSIMEESVIGSPDDDPLNDDMPISFMVNDVGTVSARMLCIREPTVDISDGKELETHTQA